MISTVSQPQLLDILAPRPQIRQPPYTTFTPVSPRRNSVPSTYSSSSNSLGNSRSNEQQMTATGSSSSDNILRTITQLPEPRLPEVPILVFNNSSSSKSSINNTTQGLLPAFVPAPYELGPNGLTLIVPRRVTSIPSSDIRYTSSLLSKNSRLTAAK